MRSTKNRIRSISFAELTERHVFHGPVVDEVRIADVLVIFSTSAHILQKHSVYMTMCEMLTELLPLASDSELLLHLSRIRPSFIVSDTIKAAQASSIEKGLSPLSVKHYKTLIDDK